MLNITPTFLTLLLLMVGLTVQNNLSAQSKNQNEYFQIISEFEQWKLREFKLNEFATEKNCNMDSVTKEGYNGSEMGIPKDIDVSFTDINNDSKLDAIITFHPEQCDGGNALMNAQIRVLILSKGTIYTTDDTFINKIESGLKRGWFSIESASYGTFFGTYFEYKDTDGRCCPSIRRPFNIDYQTKKLTFTDEK